MRLLIINKYKVLINIYKIIYVLINPINNLSHYKMSRLSRKWRVWMESTCGWRRNAQLVPA